MLRKRFTEQVKAEEARFRKWEQQLLSERDRLHKELEQQSERVKELQNELDAYYYSHQHSPRSVRKWKKERLPDCLLIDSRQLQSWINTLMPLFIIIIIIIITLPYISFYAKEKG